MRVVSYYLPSLRCGEKPQWSAEVARVFKFFYFIMLCITPWQMSHCFLRPTIHYSSRQKFDAVSFSDLGDGTPRMAHTGSSAQLPLLQTQRNSQDSKGGSSLKCEWSNSRTWRFRTWRGRWDFVALWLRGDEDGVPHNRGQHRKAGDGCRTCHNRVVSFNFV